MTFQRMLQRRGTAAEWAAKNPVLGPGELGVESDTDVVKVGDGIKSWSQLAPFMNSQYLPVLGKAADSSKLGGNVPSYFAPQSAVDTVATSVTTVNTSVNTVNNALTAATSKTSATRTLKNHWGSVTSFPSTGVLVGDTCQRTDIGTSGSVWIYSGAGKGISGWTHKGRLTCTSSTRPASGVSYGGMEIWESDTLNGYIYTGSAWRLISQDSGQISATLNSPMVPGALGSWYRKINGIVYIQFDASYNGPYAGAYSFFTLPAGYRPATRQYFVGISYAGTFVAFIAEASNGLVTYNGVAGATYTGFLIVTSFVQGN